MRAVVARDLVADGWSQTRTAQALAISQGMVSKYVAAPAPSMDDLVIHLARELRAELSQAQPATGASPWCATLSVGHARSGGDEALADLLAAQRILEESPPLALIPQIGLNLVRCLPGAETPKDVLGFPGRLVEAEGRLVGPAPPTFGGSGHLARCLLHLRVRDESVAAMASLRGGSDVASLLPKGVPQVRVREVADPDAGFRAASDGARQPPRMVHDGGGHGIEPCLYLAAPTAVEVAYAVLDLARRLSRQQLQ